MKGITTIFLFLIAVLSVRAQQTETPKNWSLADCITYALEISAIAVVFVAVAALFQKLNSEGKTIAF